MFPGLSSFINSAQRNGQKMQCLQHSPCLWLVGTWSRESFLVYIARNKLGWESWCLIDGGFFIACGWVCYLVQLYSVTADGTWSVVIVSNKGWSFLDSLHTFSAIWVLHSREGYSWGLLPWPLKFTGQDLTLCGFSGVKGLSPQLSVTLLKKAKSAEI